MSARGTNKPLKQFKAGAISVTIWNNTDTDRNGNTISYNTISIQRNYKDRDEWKSTSTMRINDLPKVSLLVDKAYEFLVLRTNRKNEGITSQERDKRAVVS